MYDIQIADRDGRVLWQASSTADELTLPAGVLQRGRTYFWQVLVDADSTPSPPVGFWVLDERTLGNVQSAETTYSDSALVLAATYLASGLYEDALTQLDRLTQLNPDRTEIRDARERLRGRLGRR
jgi:hypothetical protein